MNAAKVGRERAEGPARGEGKAGVGVRLRIGRRQHLALDRDTHETFYRLESGCLLVEGHVGGDRRQVALVLFPGDIICRSAVPPLPDIRLTATVPSELIRLSEATGVGATGPGIAGEASPQGQLARLAARYAMHAIVLNRLSADERLATLLVELALRFGRQTPGGCTFELPLSRTDMADFLALNPDTMSRLMSRLKADGVLTMSSRGMATVRSFEALAGRTPLAVPLQRLFAAVAGGHGAAHGALA